MVTEQEIGANSVVTRAELIVSAEVGAEMVMLHVEKGLYFDTDTVGAEVWKALAAPTSIRAICDELVRKYRVDVETCERDVLAFVRHAHEAGLVRVLSADSGA